MITTGTVAAIAATLVAALGAWTDARTGRIPNAITLPALGLALIALLIHAGDHFIRVAQNFLLMITQPLELALELLALSLCLRLLQRGLQLTQPLVDVFLTAGQVAEPVEDIARLSLRLSLLWIGRTSLGFVSILVG